MEMRPRKQSCSVGKLVSSQSKVNPRGNWEVDKFRWQKPGAGEETGVRGGGEEGVGEESGRGGQRGVGEGGGGVGEESGRLMILKVLFV